jgi:hypothetical protein
VRAAELADYFLDFGTFQFRVNASSDGIGSDCDGDIGFGAEGPELSAGPNTGWVIDISSAGSTNTSCFEREYGITDRDGLLKSKLGSFLQTQCAY